MPEPEATDIDHPLEGRLAESGGEPAPLPHEGVEQSALERRVDAAIQQITERVEAQLAEMGSTVEQLHADLSGDAIRAGAAVDRVISDMALLREAQADLRQRLDDVAERLDQDPVADGPGGIGAELSQRVEAMEADLEAANRRLTEQLESQGRSLRAAVAEGLAEVRAAVPEALAAEARRLEALDKAVARRDVELEELYDLHAALDAGMGELRSGIMAGRAADDRTRDALDEIYRRIEAMSTANVASRADQGRGRRSGKKATEPTTDAAAALAAVDELVREQRQLREQILGLQRNVDAAATAAGRATSQAAALASLRSDVRALHTQLAEQKEALETLAKTVGSLRGRTPGPAPATAKKASRTTKR